jgi:rfaE bifunctional protein nucleotidyltransferase chain/domain
MATKSKGQAVPKKKDVSKIKDILNQGSNLGSRFIPDMNELKAVVDHFRDMGYRIVLTQGVYDLIHEGHALYLENARSHGDLLIVGVDSDQLTKKRKGPSRPIVPQSERLKMLTHLRAVDIVTLREVHHDINDLVRLVKPDVFVVSETTTDFADKRYDICKKFSKKIVILPPQATTSTTARIRSLTIEGAEQLGKEVNQLVENFISKIKNGK